MDPLWREKILELFGIHMPNKSETLECSLLIHLYAGEEL